MPHAASINYRIVSIGTLAAHPLWNESVEVRTGHATTTLISTDSAHVLVNPSLPAAALLARLGERSPVRPDEITDVFLTSVDRDHRRALPVFENARWLAAQPELEAALADLTVRHDEAQAGGDAELAEFLSHDLKILRKCTPAPDRLYTGVDLFPLPGVTPGCCGLLLSMPRATVLICGDAVTTREHLEQGKVLPGCHDIEQAQESFAEAVQIADLLIPGRDNISLNPLRQTGGF